MKTSYPEKNGTAEGLKFTNQYGRYLISNFNTWHSGVHIEGVDKSIHAIADGRIIAYRFMDNYLELPKTKSSTKAFNTSNEETEEKTTYNYSNCFILIQHDIELSKDKVTNKGKENEKTETETKIVTFYSLYNHLMPINAIEERHLENKKIIFPDFIGKKNLTVKAQEQFEYVKKKRKGLNSRTLNKVGKIDWRDDSTKKVVIPYGQKVTKVTDTEGNLIKIGDYAKVTFTDINGDFYDDIYINIAPTKTRKYPRVKDHGDSFEIIIKEDNETWIDKSSVPEDKKDLKGARIRNKPTTKDSTIVDIIEHGQAVKIKEKKANGWYVLDGYEGFSGKNNFEEKVSFDDSKVTKNEVMKCDIPVKAGAHIGYTGYLTNEQNTGYAACQLDVFMEDGAEAFLNNGFKTGNTEKDLRFVKLPKDTVLEQNIEIDINLRAHLPVKVLETNGIYAKIKVEEFITETIPVAGHIYTSNVGNGKYKGYKEEPKGYDYIDFNAVNTLFDNLLDKQKSRLLWVSTPTGGLSRKVKFKPEEAGKICWVKITDLDKTAEVVQTKHKTSRVKSVHDYPSTLDFILNSWKQEVITEEVTIPIVQMTSVKKNEITKLSKNITKAFVLAPKKESAKAEKLQKDVIATIIPNTELKGTTVAKDYVKVSCSYVHQSKEFSQKGWIGSDVEKFSAFNWDKFGFKPFDGGDEYVYDLKGLRDFEENGSEFIETLLANLDIIKDDILDKDELNFAFSILEIQQEIAKMVCNHKIEWAYTPNEIAGEISKIYDYLIGKQPEEAQSELKQIKADKLEVHKAQVTNLMFWDELSTKIYSPTTNDEPYNAERKKIVKKYSPIFEDENNVDELHKPKMNIELDTLDKKHHKGKYTPKPPKFPVNKNVHHFHPIAFVNQLKLMFPQGSSDADCPELVWGKKVSCEFRKRVVQISKRLECDPNHLMAAMALETGGSFNPKKDNKKDPDADGIGYIGLIQIGNDVIKDFNKDYFVHKVKIKKRDLRAMSAEEQLCYVEYALARHKGKLKTLADFYLAILWPRAVGHGNEPNYIVFDDDSAGKKKTAYHSNPTFHREEDEFKKNSKGVVYERHGKTGGKTYVWEIAEAIQEWYDKGVPLTNTASDCPPCSCEAKCIDLTGKVTWISQFNKGERKNGVMQTDGCWRTSQKLLVNAGLGKMSGYKGGKIDTALENDTHTSIDLTTNAKAGVDYINSELEKGNPVLVGLDHTLNYRHNGKPINDGTTDHYVVIVSRGCDNNKVYYRFYEVGTSWAHHGQSSSNKLFLGDDFSLKGTPAHSKNRNYTVSQVRKNK